MKWFRQQRGATLLELVFALGLTGIFLSISVAMVAKNSQWMAQTLQAMYWKGEVRSAFRTIQRDLFALRQSEIRFFHPRMLVLRKANGERVIYALRRKTLYRNWQPVLGHLQESALFTLRDDALNPEQSIQRTWYVEVQFRFDLQPQQTMTERFYVAQ